MKYYGLYRGVCTRNNDPEDRFRIRLKVPAISGERETGWAMPCLIPGWKTGRLLDAHEADTDKDGVIVGSPWSPRKPIPHAGPDDSGAHVGHTAADGTHSHTHRIIEEVPKPGEGVWVMYEHGDLNSPVWMGVF